MKIRYTIKLECETKEDAMGLPVIHRRISHLMDALWEQKCLPEAEVRYLLIPGKWG